MNKFWKWMEEKNYCCEHDKKIWDGTGIKDPFRNEFEPTKQMLATYMIEYGVSRNVGFQIPVFWNIEQFYNELKEKIEEQDNE
jgi:hypothetical protein